MHGTQMIVMGLCCEQYFDIGEFETKCFDVMSYLRRGSGKTGVDEYVPLRSRDKKTGQVVSAHVV